MEQIGCPETSVQSYHLTLSNIPEERISSTSRWEPEVTQSTHVSNMFKNLLMRTSFFRDMTLRPSIIGSQCFEGTCLHCLWSIDHRIGLPIDLRSISPWSWRQYVPSKRRCISTPWRSGIIQKMGSSTTPLRKAQNSQIFLCLLKVP
jgi:hypothetical protein